MDLLQPRAMLVGLPGYNWALPIIVGHIEELDDC